MIEREVGKMITRLDKVTVYVNSQEEAKKFWIDKMGFELAFEQEMGPGMKWIEVAPKKDATSLVLYSKQLMQQQNPAMVAHPSVIFSADNVEETWTTLKGKGVKVDEIQNLPYGNMFSFYDNNDNIYLIRD